MSPDALDRLIAGAEAAVDVAGAVIRPYFRARLNAELKADQSPVTMADRGAEDLLRKTLLGHFPADGFLGEERGDAPGTSGYR